MENIKPIIDADNNLHLSALPEFDIKRMHQLMDDVSKTVRESRKRMKELAEEFTSRCDLSDMRRDGQTVTFVSGDLVILVRFIELWHETQDVYLGASAVLGKASGIKRQMVSGDLDAVSAPLLCNPVLEDYDQIARRWFDLERESKDALNGVK